MISKEPIISKPILNLVHKPVGLQVVVIVREGVPKEFKSSIQVANTQRKRCLDFTLPTGKTHMVTIGTTQ